MIKVSTGKQRGLFHRASRDRWDSAAFYWLCESKAVIVTVARMKNGQVLGCFTSVACPSNGGLAWANGNFIYDNTAFLFGDRADTARINNFTIKPSELHRAEELRNAFGPCF